MTPDEILRCKTKVLTQEQREDYFTHGYISVESIIDNNTLEDIVNVTNQFIEASKEIFSSGDDYDLSPGHNAERPMLRRLKRPDEKHELYWNFANGILADIATDLAGPDVVFHHSKLNFKWAGGSDAVKWHQDAQFFPHTNYNVFTIGCYLEDTNMDNGPLAVIPDSHLGPLYDQYGENGEWLGCLNENDSSKIDMSKTEYLFGPAGSITIHNCRCLHYSPKSISNSPRPLLLNCYTSADAKPYTPHPDPSVHAYELIRGTAAKWAEHDPRPCQIPPDWSNGYTSIFSAQSGEDL